MRYAIFSDIHANLEGLHAVIDAYKKESIDKYLCVGDVVGYAANPKECIDIVKETAVIVVAGNHDWGSVDLFSLDYFNPVAYQAILWTKSALDEKGRYFLASLKLIYKNEDLTLVHGTLNNPQEFDYMINEYIAQESFRLTETNICFVGHSHVAGIFVKDKYEHIHYSEDNNIDIKEENKYIINVGSVGQPRDGNAHAAYCVYDTNKRKLWIKRVRYDIETARRKIYDAGLPRYLGDRLVVGR